jgi:hypothetical protein
MNSEFPELHDFFGAYFHQDWTAEYENPEQVLDAFLHESDSESLLLALQELNQLLDRNKGELALREYLMKELSCYYSYWNSWESAESWLRHIALRLVKQIDQM